MRVTVSALQSCLFVHIPRTGGTSLTAAAAAALCVSGQPFLIDEGEAFYEKMERPRLENYRLIAGHVPFGYHSKLPHQNFTYFAVLRDPVDRFCSMRDFVKRNSDHFLHSALLHLSDEEIVDYFIQVYGDEDRHIRGQCSMVCGSNDFRRALGAIRHYYSAVADISRIEDVSAVLSHRLGVHQTKLSRLGERKDQSRAPTPRALELILDFASEDIKLWSYILRHPHFCSEPKDLMYNRTQS